MLASTKAGTLVKLVSAGKGAATQVSAPHEALEGSSLSRLVGFVLGHEARQLLAQQGRDRTVAACGQHPGLVNELVVQGQRDIPWHRPFTCTLFTCCTGFT